MPRPTLFRVLLEERRWNSWVVFCPRFEQTARQLAKELNDPRLTTLTVPRKTFERWASGSWYGRPWPDAAQVLERLLGFPCTDLFSEAPHVLHTKTGTHDRGDYAPRFLSGNGGPPHGCSCPPPTTSPMSGS